MKIILISILVLASLQAGVKHFASAGEVSKSFVSALQNADKKALANLLTPKYKEIVKIKEIDSDDVKRFLSSYEKSHKLASFDGKSVYIEVGTNSWTFPIPMLKDKDGWFFDIEAGVKNMNIREIGRNEMAMIDALRANLVYEDLLMQEDLKVFIIFQDEARIVAIPRSYDKTAIMSFVRDENSKIYEANLFEKEYIFDEGFNEIDATRW
ncbi:MAG: DUF2950 family protein [Sulfurimonas sp.]|nr:DUF2950 family protein [Sulfurimonas sp.]